MYRYIIRFKRAHAGDSPSRREIMQALGLPSVSMVQHHLLALEAAGRIVRPNCWSAITSAANWATIAAGRRGREPPPNWPPPASRNRPAGTCASSLSGLEEEK